MAAGNAVSATNGVTGVGRRPRRNRFAFAIPA